jgi:S-adenosylmethionine:tRNA ribosyltransferase-isomerase
MKTRELDYDLPDELIAQQPAENRGESRLLVLERKTPSTPLPSTSLGTSRAGPSTMLRAGGRITDSRFADIGDFLRDGDCLVLNDTKVLAARFYARRQTGGRVEGLFLGEPEKGVWEVMLKGAGKVKTKEKILLKDIEGKDYCCAVVVEKKDEGKCLMRVETEGKAEVILEAIGFAPVPPYIRRDTDSQQVAKDKQRYQTVYARHAGAVAAPTAGLHWTKELLAGLEDKGIKVAYITLHVGEGTFRPVTTETIEEHKIHPEWFSIDEKNAGLINAVKRAGGRIVAVGTTSVRTLESAAKETAEVTAMSGPTELFIVPGYRFKMVDAMVTNFHLPRSTLLALVAAFAGLETIMSAYKYAIEKRYRFYSYGDAMLVI